ncbi:histidine kinase [Mucilaginibacter yixingensis]|uniref:Histidine kinase n=1 Tax=Mucilaginibacter yixingensis TaxID=1295612 RepID=A0A2T5JGA1_9SPHI|nr:histidine kinase [Mucilaginibacter yixingensis]PTR01396.1 histidine kinase [Mucilaginibacter yixingensis]
MDKQKLKISPAVIWVSSVTIGLLSSVPQIAQQHFNLAEAVVNAAITSAFALAMWYVNLYMLARRPEQPNRQKISYSKLINTLLIGLLVMFGLAWVQQLILSHINFGPVMLMVEVRGILINLVFYMFLQLLQQNYENQYVNMELERIKNDNLGAQYELLKQQVNPHFLFNSLNTLKAMVETSDKDSVDFILKLSNFYRFTLESRKHDLIHLSEEMEIVKAYLFLQNARFEGGFTFTSDLDDEVLKTQIPPFTLQLLVENCIKHNVVSLDKPLHIRLYAADDRLILENPIQQKTGERNSLGVGLKNIQLRYEHLLHQQIDIVNNGQLFQVKLPLIS